MPRRKTSKRKRCPENGASPDQKPSKRRQTTREPAEATEESKEKVTRKSLQQRRTASAAIGAEGDAKVDSTKVQNDGDCVVTKFVGAHTSISGGLHKAVLEAVNIGGKSFGLFLKSQRQWNAKPMEEVAVQKFKDACAEHGFSPQHILPHGSYLVNCGSPNEETFEKSRATLVDELQRCERLGLTLYNFHPGSTCGKITVDECLDRIAGAINHAHAQTKSVTTVIENMCGQGNTVGGKFEELKGIIDRVSDKSRMGVCLDTCHAFAAGFNIATQEGYDQMMSDFDNIVGMKYLKAIHLNDSKGKLGCHLDRHENIGRGHLGLSTFTRIMNDKLLDNIPMIIETPPGLSDKEEIDILYSLVNAV